MGKKLTTEEFIARAKEVHGNKYDYTESTYINNSTKIKIICKNHGVFEQIPKTHTHRSYGCPYCGGRAMTTELFINKSNNIHNYKYDYSLVDYTLKTIPVTIICPEHGVFEQTPDHHMNSKCGCPKCSKKHYPKSEQLIEKYLTTHNIPYIHQKEFDGCVNKFNLSFDFYLPDFNLCVECDGEQHYKPIEFFGGLKSFKNRVMCDNIKTKFCEDNRIKLIRIPYTEFNNIESILTSELLLLNN